MSTEARTNVGDNSLSLMRATLRAPPSKWAIEAFFPESPCRVLSLVLSFASKESTPPSGRQPHHSRRSRRVDPPAGEPRHETIRSFSCVPPPQGGSPTVPAGAMGMRLRAHQRAFRSPFGNLRAPKVAEPHRTTNSNPRRSQRVQPRRDCLTRKLLFA